MKKQYKNLIYSLIIIILVLFSFISYNQWPFLTGNTMVLEIIPIDPFDPFMGQYMVLNYDISNISELKRESKVYVSLNEDENGIWRKTSVSIVKPEGDFIKGIREENSSIVKYGIEQFFFERNAKVPTENLTAEIKVDNTGRAVLIQLLQNGKPIEIEYQEFDIRS